MFEKRWELYKCPFQRGENLLHPHENTKTTFKEVPNAIYPLIQSEIKYNIMYEGFDFVFSFAAYNYVMVIICQISFEYSFV